MMRPDPEGDDLLLSAARGNEVAWARIVRQYQRLVFTVIRDFSLDVDDGEDVFQEVFLRLHTNLERIEGLRHLPRWIALVTRRLCIDHTVSEGRVRRVPPGWVEPEPLAPPDEDIVRYEQQQVIREALARIDTRCRSLIEVLFIEQETPDYTAAAARLDMPVGSVGPTRARCFGKLMRALRRTGFFDDETR